MSFLPAADYLNAPRAPQTWVVKDLLPTGGSMLLHGKPKSGKSLLSVSLCAHVSSGAPSWLGQPILSNGPVAYLQLDTPRTLWAHDLEMLQTAGYDISNVYFADREMVPEIPFDIRRATCHGWLKQTLSSLPIRPLLLVVDVWKEFFTGDENEAAVAQEVMAYLVDATAPTSLVIVTHPKKGNGMYTPDLLDAGRGSSYLPGKVDCVCQLDEKHFTFKSRTAPETKLHITKGPGFVWTLSTDEVEQKAKELLHTMKGQPELRVAKALASHTSLSVEAARSKIRRLGG